MAPEADRQAELATLRADEVTYEQVRELFIRYDTHHPPIASAGMLTALMDLSDHPDKWVRRMVVEGASVDEMKLQALEEGMLTLRRVGVLNAARGTTTVEEVLRITLDG